MKLHEYKSKEILASFGIPIPKGKVISHLDDIQKSLTTLRLPIAVKAQVLVGGRGKAGGIKIAKTSEEVRSAAEQIFKMKIKGLPVKKILLEEALEIAQENYLGIVLDRSGKGSTAIFSAVGGVDIEEIARTQPEAIHKIQNPGADAKDQKQYSQWPIPSEIVTGLAKIYHDQDAVLAEINPLVKTKSGQWVAADAKIIIDDNALFRHPAFSGDSEESFEDELEAEANRRKMAYVRLPGNIAVISNGAGLTMTTMDEVKQAGGAPACFLDVGGGSRADLICDALELIMRDPNIQGIFFNIFGGITRCDEVVRGIIAANEKSKIKVPVVIRLTGTREEEGRALLSQTDVLAVRSMQEGARKIVAMVSENNSQKRGERR
jgi:succinyl-CoA synthetase beta subunit